MELQRIVPNQELIQAIEANGKARNTRLAYDATLAEFNALTGNKTNTPSIDLVKGYLFAIASKGAKLSTIKLKAEALRYHFKFDNNDIKEYMAGLANTMASNNRTSTVIDSAKPISKALLLRKVDELTRLGTKKALRDKTLITLGWLGAYRISELINIRYSDLEKTDLGYKVHIFQSKNLRANEKDFKFFPESASLLCPVHTIDTYLEAFPRSGEGFLFNGFRKGDIEQPTPVKKRAVQGLISTLFGKEYSAHSLRSGFVTEAIEQGATYSAIANQTGHKSLQSISSYDQSSKVKNNAVNAIL